MKVTISIIIITVVILGGGVWLLGSNGAKEEAKLSKPLVGDAIADQGANHVPEGTLVTYLTNPPTGGSNYTLSAKAGIYDKSVPDGNLIHSMEHGAVILWYNGLSKQDIERLKQIFNSVSISKKIMVPHATMDVSIALTSWGRLLKLQAIDEVKIKTFMETNENRAPEKAPL